MTEIKLTGDKGVRISDRMTGLFFEDINYAADGGLYAELIENRSFGFLKATGVYADYQTEYDGCFAWDTYSSDGDKEGVCMKLSSASPHTEENPNYLRVETIRENLGIKNKCYDGLALRNGVNLKLLFFVRCVSFTGRFIAMAVDKEGREIYRTEIESASYKSMTSNFFARYEGEIVVKGNYRNLSFVVLLSEPGVVEFDYISVFPSDAVCGIFRKDLFEKLEALKPGFIRFPGGCIVEGNTLSNRYRFKETLKDPWKRRNNWNRWAVHGNNEENRESAYSHYNQTCGLGFYEFFLLCELLGAEPLPVVNVGLACQYQSKEVVPLGTEEFETYIKDAIDLIDFATGNPETSYWGKVRNKMGHPKPFSLSLMGIGNEQWQAKGVDYFERYTTFERAIHAYAPHIRLIGSAGPDITSEKYDKAWRFYRANRGVKNFVFAIDEHYYVNPGWLIENVGFYDKYDRGIKVFAGEYAAHPDSGFNNPKANTLGGALAEAAFMLGLERNADLVVMASYAPLFARINYAQWSPDLIWFDAQTSYKTPSYLVQELFANNRGEVILRNDFNTEKAKETKIHYSVSLHNGAEDGSIIIKAVNLNDTEERLSLVWGDKKKTPQYEDYYTAASMSGEDLDSFNSIEDPEKIKTLMHDGAVSEGIVLKPNSFTCIRIRIVKPH